MSTPEIRAAAELALQHVQELREAWRTGALRDSDGKGGERPNRNVSVEVALRDALAASPKPPRLN